MQTSWKLDVSNRAAVSGSNGTAWYSTPGTPKVSALPSGGKNSASSVVAEIHGTVASDGETDRVAVHVFGTEIRIVPVSSSRTAHDAGT